MQITNSSTQTAGNPLDNTKSPAPRIDGSAPGAAGPHSPPATAASPAEQPSGLVLSYEWLSLSVRLQQLPPVRADVVAEVAGRLASGQLGTADAVGRTAQAILGS